MTNQIYNLNQETFISFNSCFHSVETTNETTGKTSNVEYSLVLSGSTGFLNGKVDLTFKRGKTTLLVYTFDKLILDKNVLSISDKNGINEIDVKNQIIDKIQNNFTKHTDQRLLLFCELLSNDVVKYELDKNNEKSTILAINKDTYIDCVLKLGKKLNDLNYQFTYEFSVIYNFCFKASGLEQKMIDLYNSYKGQLNDYQTALDTKQTFKVDSLKTLNQEIEQSILDDNHKSALSAIILQLTTDNDELVKLQKTTEPVKTK